MQNTFGGTLNFSTLELFEQLIKKTDPAEIDEAFNWEEYNKEVEELALAASEQAAATQARLVQDDTSERLAVTHISKIVGGFLTEL